MPSQAAGGMPYAFLKSPVAKSRADCVAKSMMAAIFLIFFIAG